MPEQKKIGEFCSKGKRFDEINNSLGNVEGKVDELKKDVKAGFANIEQKLDEKLDEKNTVFTVTKDSKGIKIVKGAGLAGGITVILGAIIYFIKELINGAI
jgi:hypothetical protein